MTAHVLSQRSSLVKEAAITAGFDQCGISKADFLEEEAPRLESWLQQAMHGEMHYMANHFDKRLDPRKLVEGAKSVISVILNYYPEKEFTSQAAKISKYAYGTDYHTVLKEKLAVMVNLLQQDWGDFTYRIFTDSAPVMDKVWAAKSGLGWVGKHSNLINRTMGSFFFIGEIICDVELQPDAPVKDYCGTCTRCVDACPTQAITQSYLVDGSKCISYATIELKAALPIPQEFKGKMEHWAFGCDICQDVCPWNRFSKPSSHFKPLAGLESASKNDFKELTEEVFNEITRLSPLKRTRYQGFIRNLRFLENND